MMENKKLNFNGYAIHYMAAGQGSEIIVMLHPAFSDHRAFQLQLEFFSKRYRVVVPDLIGHGQSKVKNTNDKLEASSEHILDIIKQEGFEKAHVIGVSMGSLIAQFFAFKYPENVKSLVGLGGYSIHIENKEVAKAQLVSNLGLIGRALVSLSWFRAKVTSITCYTLAGQSLFKKSMSLFERKSFMYMQGLQHVIKSRPAYTTKTPTLILVGEKDIPLAHRMAKQWHESINGSEFYIINGGGHCAQLDVSNTFNNRVEQFIHSI